MDLNWFDDVLVLLEERNMTRAAERRNITQPAFSRRIRCFEDWLGTPLVERLSNRVDINQALLENEEEIRAFVARLRELRAKLAYFDEGRSTVTIAAQHAAVVSTFPDMALQARKHLPGINFRLRAGNSHDCVTQFLRGDASMLLCYEAESVRTLEFGANTQRGIWGTDFLVPVIGGAFRSTVKDTGWIPENTPSVVYPENSFFGEVLDRAEKSFGTTATSLEPICVSAFSSGVKELVSRGIGVGWVPFSMVHGELAKGGLISLTNHLGKVPLEVAIFADSKTSSAIDLFKAWTQG